MKKHLLTILLQLCFFAATAQVIDDAKVGIGLTLINTEYLVPTFEGELTKKWHRILSNSVALGIGYFNKDRFKNSSVHRISSTQLDLNIFLSPFGNEGTYNLKLGSGLSLMYVHDYGFFSGNVKRLLLGHNIILENEFTIRKKYLAGLKLMIQPYYSLYDINSSLIFKFGKRF